MCKGVSLAAFKSTLIRDVQRRGKRNGKSTGKQGLEKQDFLGYCEIPAHTVFSPWPRWGNFAAFIPRKIF